MTIKRLYIENFINYGNVDISGIDGYVDGESVVNIQEEVNPSAETFFEKYGWEKYEDYKKLYLQKLTYVNDNSSNNLVIDTISYYNYIYGRGQISLGVYEDNEGIPGNLMDNVIVDIPTSNTYRWIDISLNSTFEIGEGESIWVGFLLNGSWSTYTNSSNSSDVLQYEYKWEDNESALGELPSDLSLIDKIDSPRKFSIQLKDSNVEDVFVGEEEYSTLIYNFISDKDVYISPYWTFSEIEDVQNYSIYSEFTSEQDIETTMVIGYDSSSLNKTFYLWDRYNTQCTDVNGVYRQTQNITSLTKSYFSQGGKSRKFGGFSTIVFIDKEVDLSINGISIGYYPVEYGVNGHQDPFFTDDMEEFYFQGVRLPVSIKFPKNYNSENAEKYPLMLWTPGDLTTGDNTNYSNYEYEGRDNYGGYVWRYPAIVIGSKFSLWYHRADLECISIGLQRPTYTSKYTDGVLRRYINGKTDMVTGYYPLGDSGEDLAEGLSASHQSREDSWWISAIIAFTRTLIEKNDYKIDENKIYFQGASRGACDALFLMLQGRDVFAGCFLSDGYFVNTRSDKVFEIIEKMTDRIKHIPLFFSTSRYLESISRPDFLHFPEDNPFEGFTFEGADEPPYTQILIPKEGDEKGELVDLSNPPKDVSELQLNFDYGNPSENPSYYPTRDTPSGPPYYIYSDLLYISGMIREKGGFSYHYYGNRSHDGGMTSFNNETWFKILLSCSKNERRQPDINNPGQLLSNKLLPNIGEDSYPSGDYYDEYEYKILHSTSFRQINNNQFYKFRCVGYDSVFYFNIKGEEITAAIVDNSFIWKYGSADSFKVERKDEDNPHTFEYYMGDISNKDIFILKYNNYWISWQGSSIGGSHYIIIDTKYFQEEKHDREAISYPDLRNINSNYLLPVLTIKINGFYIKELNNESLVPLSNSLYNSYSQYFYGGVPITFNYNEYFPIECQRYYRKYNKNTQELIEEEGEYLYGDIDNFYENPSVGDTQDRHCLSFNGVNEYVTFKDVDADALTFSGDDISFSFWFKLNEINKEQYLVSTVTGFAPVNIKMYINDENKVIGYFHFITGDFPSFNNHIIETVSITEVEVNKWYLINFTLSNDNNVATGRLYLNSNLEDTKTNNVPYSESRDNPAFTNFCIGASSNSFFISSHSNGYIDDLRIYNGVRLSQSNIDNIYNSGYGTTETEDKFKSLTNNGVFSNFDVEHTNTAFLNVLTDGTYSTLEAEEFEAQFADEEILTNGDDNPSAIIPFSTINTFQGWFNTTDKDKSYIQFDILNTVFDERLLLLNSSNNPYTLRWETTSHIFSIGNIYDFMKRIFLGEEFKFNVHRFFSIRHENQIDDTIDEDIIYYTLDGEPLENIEISIKAREPRVINIDKHKGLFIDKESQSRMFNKNNNTKIRFVFREQKEVSKVVINNGGKYKQIGVMSLANNTMVWDKQGIDKKISIGETFEYKEKDTNQYIKVSYIETGSIVFNLEVLDINESSAIYEDIAKYIAESYDLGIATDDHFNTILNNINLMDVSRYNNDREFLYNAFKNNKISVYQKHQKYSSSLIYLVKSLNEYILENYDYNSIDDFITSNLITIKRSFANISTNIGYPVSESNIED